MNLSFYVRFAKKQNHPYVEFITDARKKLT